MYICLCFAVTGNHIEQAVTQGATRFKDLRENLGVATQCGRCRNCAHECLKESLATKDSCQTQKRETAMCEH